VTITTPDLLATIVAGTRTAVAFRESACPIVALQRQTERLPRGDAFVDALRSSAPPRVIAECKRRSPSKGILRDRYDPAAHARSYEEGGAAAISVLTEPTFFDGSLDHLRAVRAAVSIPILRKDFIVTDYQVHESAAHGADAILLIAGAFHSLDELRRLLDLSRSLGLAALVEVHDEEELARAAAAGAEIIGVNSRSLRTLAVDHEVLDRLGPCRSPGATAAAFVAESGIRSGDDIRRLTALGYDAFLVGERLITRPDPGDALRELRELRTS
jgi:indole-3-glycerol phosphate synthase